MNVLIIEDDTTLNQNISEALQAEGIIVTSIYDGLLAERTLKRNTFDCVVMDINLPGKNGFDLCSDFRQFNTNTPVIMLTAFGELDDKIQGFNCGADDYLTKPFYMRELLLRIHSLVKRANTKDVQNAIITADDIVIDTKTKSVTRQGEAITLTPREYQILLRLIENKGELVSKKELIQEIWGNILEANTNTIEVYINFLRNKIDKPFRKQNIKTKVGYGYYFE
ncbi:MAG: response regulator transcription factor [Chitinophagales bacterium]|nr:response regulator transcription factor [Chitinophagales bacterium]MCO5281227.1 response regulator transcription factor [Chitinophagales bacterium]OJV25533.1 MAG: DNA-binding response regulator [Bacteroidetes bacterium 37-13]HRN94442.1 response regulator transcription factor [Chitinophagales bacterium]HRP38122.1 response regulator transcription factor [Chitinophagales bacterium]